MKKIIALSSIMSLAGCETMPLRKCTFSFEPATTEAITEMAVNYGPPSRELIFIPDERDEVSGKIISPARTEESKKEYPEELGEVTRIINKPATYRIFDEKRQNIKTMGEKEFVNFQKIHNCGPVVSQQTGGQ